jgi:hypothetical protein
MQKPQLAFGCRQSVFSRPWLFSQRGMLSLCSRAEGEGKMNVRLAHIKGKSGSSQITNL